MVFKFPLHRICIIIGLCFCVYGSIVNINNTQQPASSDSAFFNRLLIIDAGHGGADGGAVGIDGTTESSINLDIALKLNTLGHLFGVSTIMTRNSEELDYPDEAKSISAKKSADQNARLRLIQDYPHGILFSIHQNSYPSTKVSGIQILYGHSEESAKIGELVQNLLNETLNPMSRRVAAEISDEIYLMRNCECSAVLIECGFISNPEECKRLQSEEYQKKLAVAMLAAYKQCLIQ